MPAIIMKIIESDNKLVLLTRIFVAVDNGNYFISDIFKVMKDLPSVLPNSGAYI